MPDQLYRFDRALGENDLETQDVPGLAFQIQYDPMLINSTMMALDQK